jgi:hypothetical protein
MGSKIQAFIELLGLMYSRTILSLRQTPNRLKTALSQSMQIVEVMYGTFS